MVFSPESSAFDLPLEPPVIFHLPLEETQRLESKSNKMPTENHHETICRRKGQSKLVAWLKLFLYLLVEMKFTKKWNLWIDEKVLQKNLMFKPCGFYKKFGFIVRCFECEKRPFKSFIPHKNDNYLKEGTGKVKN